MAKTTFDIKKIEIPAEVTRPLYAGVGATDLAVELVRNAVADVQKRLTSAQQDVSERVADVQKSVKNADLEPRALRDQAVTAVNARVSGLQDEAKGLRGKVTSTIDETASTVTGTYVGLAERGEKLVVRIRNQESTQQAKSAAKTTTAKAKTTRTQGASSAKKTTTTAKKQGSAAAKTAKSSTSSTAKSTASAARTTAANAETAAKKSSTATKSAAKKTTTTAKKSSAPARSSAKAMTTAAKKTAEATTKAVSDAAEKVGD